jgi:hypothetical protein
MSTTKKSRKGRHAINKGKRSEREVIKLLQPIVDKLYTELYGEPPVLQRNTIQSDRGGFDIVGLDWLALEVKHCETFNLNAWWKQALEQAGTKKEPVLIYKRNNVEWRIRMYCTLCVHSSRFTGVSIGDMKACADIDLKTFLFWFSQRLAHEIKQAIATGRLVDSARKAVADSMRNDPRFRPSYTPSVMR